MRYRAKTTPKTNPNHAFNERWVYGDLIHSGEKMYIHPQNSLVYVDGELGKVIVMYEVLAETVCRYVVGSGFSCGARFWENDIIQYEDAIGVIKYGLFNSKYVGFYIEWQGKFHDYRNDIAFWLPKVTVIGNTIDHPEFIKAGDSK